MLAFINHQPPKAEGKSYLTSSSGKTRRVDALKGSTVDGSWDRFMLVDKLDQLSKLDLRLFNGWKRLVMNPI